MRVRTSSVVPKVALLVVSFAVTVALAELVLRRSGWRPMEHLQSFRFFRYDPELGWAHIRGKEQEFSSPNFRIWVRINEKGLRDRDHAYERSGVSNRVLVLGDSLAWGHGVEEENRFSEVLESELSAEVINAGVAGYGTDQELLWLREEGVKYDVDLVVVVFCGNDVRTNHQQLVYERYYKPYFRVQGDGLALQNVPVPKHLAHGEPSLGRSVVMAARTRSSFLNLFWTELLERTEAPALGEPERPFELTIRLLQEMRDLARSRGARFMLVATPEWWDPPSGRPFSELVGALEREGFLVAEIEAADGYDAAAMEFPGDGHWNEEGHRFVASRARALIEAHHLLERATGSEP